MKKIILTLTIMMVGILMLRAANESKPHDHKTQTGPNGGKVLKLSDGHVEFFVQEDKKIRITFIDDHSKIIPSSEQIIKAHAETKSGKVTFDFQKAGDSFISQGALPEGQPYQIVLQIRSDPSSKPQNMRINYDATICKECQQVEYACTCDHH